MYERIEITFKSGDTIIIDGDNWDDYAYDGKCFIVKKCGARVAFYNMDSIFSVELK